MKTRILILLTLLVAVTSILILSHKGKLAQLLSATGTSNGRYHSKADAPGKLPIYHWPQGEHASYRFVSHSGIAQESQPLEASHAGNVDVNGILNTRVLKHEADIVYVGMQFAQAEVKVGGTRAASLEALLNDNVVVASFLTTGRIAHLTLPEHLDTTDQNFLRQLFDIDMSLPESDHTGTQWVITEEDVSGSYRAEFQLEKTHQIQKQKSAYTHLHAENLEITVQASQWTGTIGEFWLDSLHGSETLSYKAGDQWSAIGTFTMNLKLLPTHSINVQDQLWTLNTTLPLSELLGQVVASASLNGEKMTAGAWAREQRQARLKKFQGMPFSAINHELEKAVGEMTEHADTVAAIHNLRDWLLANPDQADSITDAVGAQPASQLSARLIHALELAGETPEAQDALASILAATDNAHGVRLQAAVAAGGLNLLKSTDLGEALWQSAFAAKSDTTEQMEVGDSSLLALGILAEHDPELAQALTSELDSYLDTTASNHPRDIVTALRTLQNASVTDEATISKVAGLAQHHDEPAVRAAAVRYFEQQDAANPQLVIDALDDPAEQVQMAAVKTLASHPELPSESVDSLIELFNATDAPESVRGQIAQTLGRVHNQHPAATAALENLLTVASLSPSLKGTIEAALALGKGE